MIRIETKSNLALAIIVSGVFRLIGCFAGESSPEELGDQPTDHQPIVGGRPASAYPEAALVNLQGAYCSGAIIAPRIALTAGDDDGDGYSGP
jgi:hypothetical protein